MSRMTKFLKQSCIFAAAKRDTTGQVEHSRYGEVLYRPEMVLKCRCEPYEKDVTTTAGSIVRCNHRYFLDASTAIHVDDLLDGHSVLQVHGYTGNAGVLEGYECYV